MSAYAYKALDRIGRIVRGTVDADGDEDLDRRLEQMGLTPIRTSRVRSRRGAGRLSRRQLAQFCFQLEQLTRAGVPLLDGLADLRDSADSPAVRAVAASLAASVSAGRPLSDAMAAFPKSFDPVFVGIVRAGEASGHIPEVLARLGESLRWQDELAGQFRRAAAYPAFIAILLAAATVFLVVYLVPQIRQLVRGLGLALPLSTRALFAVADLIAAYGPILAAIPPAAWFATRVWLRRRPSARLAADRLILSLPGIGPVVRKFALARFAETLALLYAAGVPVTGAIATAAGVVGNRSLRAGLGAAGNAIADGRGIAAAFGASGLFPPFVTRMLHLGERTGRLDAALRDVAYFYDRDVRQAADRAQALAEPVMTASLGALLAWVMLSLLGPLYDLVAAVGG